MTYGSDGWVVYPDIDALHLGVVNIKVSEGSTARADDTDAFAFVATYKLSDTMTAGINFTNLNDRSGKSMNTFYGTTAFSNAVLQNMEAHFAGTVGPAKLKVEVDVQSGDATTQTVFATPVKHKFKGNQVVLEANIALDPVTVNATIARGSGATANTASPDMKEYIALMDADMHYTLIYEYLVPTAAQQSFATLHTGFGNTTAVSLGAGVNVTKNFMIGADLWYLQATKKVATYTDILGNDVLSDKLGIEIDAKINWKLYENLSWNNTIGYFMPGDAYKISAIQDADNARAIMSVLSFKF
jgi:outer membrane protein W